MQKPIHKSLTKISGFGKRVKRENDSRTGPTNPDLGIHRLTKIGLGTLVNELELKAAADTNPRVEAHAFGTRMIADSARTQVYRGAANCQVADAWAGID